METRRHQSGFTLFELMLTLGLAAVLMGLAAPSVSGFIRSSRISSAARDLTLDFALARDEAVMRGRRVTVCASANLVACSNDSWDRGRLVFVDGGVAGSVDGTDLVLVRSEAPDSVVWTSAAGIAAAHRVSFPANGRLTAVGRIGICVEGQTQRRVDLTRSGAATLNRTTTAC